MSSKERCTREEFLWVDEGNDFDGTKTSTVGLFMKGKKDLGPGVEFIE